MRTVATFALSLQLLSLPHRHEQVSCMHPPHQQPTVCTPTVDPPYPMSPCGKNLSRLARRCDHFPRFIRSSSLSQLLLSSALSKSHPISSFISRSSVCMGCYENEMATISTVSPPGGGGEGNRTLTWGLTFRRSAFSLQRVCPWHVRGS